MDWPRVYEFYHSAEFYASTFFWNIFALPVGALDEHIRPEASYKLSGRRLFEDDYICHGTVGTEGCCPRLCREASIPLQPAGDFIAIDAYQEVMLGIKGTNRA